MTDEEFSRRSAEDFRFMVLAQAKGNMAMYRMLRDRDLDAEREARKHGGTDAELRLWEGA